MLFGGNLVRQPVFVQIKKDRPESFRAVGKLTGADTVMEQAIFLGTYPGLSKAMLARIGEIVCEYLKSKPT